jgi:hypothetical protein
MRIASAAKLLFAINNECSNQGESGHAVGQEIDKAARSADMASLLFEQFPVARKAIDGIVVSRADADTGNCASLDYSVPGVFDQGCGQSGCKGIFQ